jgi:hypothetical protein
MENDAKEILPRLDRLVSDLCALGLYEYADRLEEFTGDLEERMTILTIWSDDD